MFSDDETEDRSSRINSEVCGDIQVSKKLNMVKKLFFSCNLFQKVKLSYILDSLHVK